MGPAWRALRHGGTADLTTLVRAYILVGIAVPGLVAWRLVLRLSRGVPDTPAEVGTVVKLAGATGHRALYALLVLAPVTGPKAWYGGITALADGTGRPNRCSLS